MTCLKGLNDICFVPREKLLSDFPVPVQFPRTLGDVIEKQQEMCQVSFGAACKLYSFGDRHDCWDIPWILALLHDANYGLTCFVLRCFRDWLATS